MGKKLKRGRIVITDSVGEKLDNLKGASSVTEVYEPKEAPVNFVDLIGEDAFFGDTSKSKKTCGVVVILLLVIVLGVGVFYFLSFIKNLLV